MNKLPLLWVPVLLTLLFVSCKDDDPDNYIDPVMNVRLIPLAEKVTVTWKNPRSNILDYVEVSYNDRNGNLQKKDITEFIGEPASGLSTAYTTFDFSDQGEYEFILVACSHSGIRSEPVRASAASLPSTYDIILNTLRIEPAIEGAVLTWENSYGYNMTVRMTWEVNGNLKTADFNTLQTNRGVVSGLGVSSIPVTVTVLDEKGSSKNPVTVTLHPLDAQRERKIEKKVWTIVGYSSQEEIGEAAPHHGRAENAIDDRNDTWWHSQYIDGAPDFPHWIIVDMSKEQYISRFSIIRRWDWEHCHLKHRFFVSSDNLTWTEVGTYSFDPDTNDEQFSGFEGVYRCRYFKLELLEGRTQYGYISEVSAYGFDTEN